MLALRNDSQFLDSNSICVEQFTSVFLLPFYEIVNSIYVGETWLKFRPSASLVEFLIDGVKFSGRLAFGLYHVHLRRLWVVRLMELDRLDDIHVDVRGNSTYRPHSLTA